LLRPRYWLDPYSLFLIEVILVQFAELRRWQDFRHPGSMGKQYFLGLESVLGGSGDPSYPGAPALLACRSECLHWQAQLLEHGHGAVHVLGRKEERCMQTPMI
jgi:hypothetical protein